MSDVLHYIIFGWVCAPLALESDFSSIKVQFSNMISSCAIATRPDLCADALCYSFVYVLVAMGFGRNYSNKPGEESLAFVIPIARRPISDDDNKK